MVIYHSLIHLGEMVDDDCGGGGMDGDWMMVSEMELTLVSSTQ